MYVRYDRKTGSLKAPGFAVPARQSCLLAVSVCSAGMTATSIQQIPEPSAPGYFSRPDRFPFRKDCFCLFIILVIMTFRSQTSMYKLRLAPRHGCFRTLIVRSAFTISVYHFCGNLGRKKQNRFIQSIFGREDRIGMFGVYSGEKTGSGCSEYIREKRQDRGIFRAPAEAQNLYRSI